MTIGDRLSKAIASVLAGTSGISPAVQTRFEENPTTEANNRIIVKCDSATEKAPVLRGLYECRGEVILMQSIDEYNALQNFRFQCELIRNTIGNGSSMATNVMANDSGITIYNRSWYLENMTEDTGDRGYSATFSWRTTASIA